MHSAISWDSHTLWKESHDRVNQHIDHLTFVFSWWACLRSTQRKFRLYDTELSTVVNMLHISSSGLVDFITASLYPFIGVVSKTLFWGLRRVWFKGASWEWGLQASTVTLVPPSPLVHVLSLLSNSAWISFSSLYEFFTFHFILHYCCFNFVLPDCLPSTFQFHT